MPRTSVVLLLWLPAAALAGCGTSADRDQSRAAVQALYAAVQRHDGAAACAQMSPSLRQQIVHDSGSRCAKAVLDFDLHGGRPTAVEVYADAAEVRLAGGDTAFLDRRLAACRRERGLLPNLVAVDFYRQGDLFAVVDRLNATG